MSFVFGIKNSSTGDKAFDGCMERSGDAISDFVGNLRTCTKSVQETFTSFVLSPQSSLCHGAKNQTLFCYKNDEGYAPDEKEEFSVSLVTNTSNATKLFLSCFEKIQCLNEPLKEEMSYVGIVLGGIAALIVLCGCFGAFRRYCCQKNQNSQGSSGQYYSSMDVAGL
jgi:hypothetical protein